MEILFKFVLGKCLSLRYLSIVQIDKWFLQDFVIKENKHFRRLDRKVPSSWHFLQSCLPETSFLASTIPIFTLFTIVLISTSIYMQEVLSFLIKPSYKSSTCCRRLEFALLSIRYDATRAPPAKTASGISLPFKK